MPRAEFEPTIPVLQRSKTKRAQDRAATGTGKYRINVTKEKKIDIFKLRT
jgi:hypothetical protein